MLGGKSDFISDINYTMHGLLIEKMKVMNKLFLTVTSSLNFSRIERWTHFRQANTK